MGSIRQESGRRHIWRGLRIGGFVVVLLLMVAVPVLANGGPTSSSDYNFATTGAQGAPGLWKNTNQTVSIIATPTVDTTATVYFSSNNGGSYSSQTANATGTATFDFVVSAEGSNAIMFYATNSSPEATESVNGPFFVNIDKTNPTFTTTDGLAPVSSQSAEALWSKVTTRTVTLTATDTVPSLGTATSGVEEISRRVHGGTVDTTQTASVTFTVAKGVGTVVEGSNEVTYTAKDWAGNVESGTGYVNMDTVAPTTTATPALASSATTGWRNTPLLVTLDWTDVSSGVPAGGTTYIINSGSPQTYVLPFTVGTATSNASYSVQYFSTDRAGNVEATHTGYVNIDTSIPTVSATTSPSRSSGWYNKDVTVTLTGVDTVSGIDKTQYRLQEDPPLLWIDAVGNEFTVPAGDNAEETFNYQAVDKAGNVSAPASLKLKMDSIKPRTFGKNAFGKVGKSVAVKYRITDNLSPKAQAIWFKIKNSSGMTIKSQSISGTKKINTWHSFNWKPKANGIFKYYVYAKDLAGNPQKSPPGSAKIKVR